MNFVEMLIESKIVNIHTAFIGKVLSVNGNIARVQPLTYSKNVRGELKAQTPVAVYIPQNIKVKQETITYDRARQLKNYDGYCTRCREQTAILYIVVYRKEILPLKI